jgi:hypothetical protein
MSSDLSILETCNHYVGSAKVSEISSLPNVSGEARNVEETATDESKQNSWTLSGIWNAIAHKRFYATPVTHPSWPSSVRDELTSKICIGFKSD